MASQVVLTAIASDRPGVVERLAEVIADAGGNWVESSMARLGGEFAGIVSVDLDPSAVGGLKEKLSALASEGIAVTLRAGTDEPEETGASARLELLSQDHPGIVRAITGILTEHGVSIEHLETSVGPGSMSGEPMFKAMADLRLPAGLSPSDLGDALQEIAGDMMADITLGDG